MLVRDAVTHGQTDARLVPAGVLLGVPGDLTATAEMLGVGVVQLEPMRGGALQAELDVPSGIWRVWPDHALAMWIGRTPEATMPHVAHHHRAALDLLTAILRLHRTGTWLQEASLCLSTGERTEVAPLEAIVASLRTHGDHVSGVAGFWGDASGQVIEAEIFRAGEIRTDNPTTTVRWLEIAFGLND